MPQPRNPTPIPDAEGILEEHRLLHSHLERIDSTLAAPPPPGAVAAWVAGLASSLRELLPLLRGHFKREEEGRLFAQVQELWPNTAQVCARLLDEHGTLLTRLERLQAETEAKRLDEQALPALVARLRALSKDLALHEERENELLVRSLDDAMAAQD